ncbi:MAG: hypothetical protein KY410_01985 [Proteobacteria bacterium]|nr:hypothetical protein [Pseudomonadota bacterium]
MTQQVNLYQPILRREKKVFSAVAMLQFLGVITLVMLALFAFNRWQLGELQAEHQRLQEQERALAARVTEISRERTAQPESRELRRQLEAAQREELLKRKLVDLMARGTGGSTVAFSEAFAGLARQRVTGLWLTGIALEADDMARDVTLSGMTTQAEFVPRLVQQLGSEPAFQGVRFRHMRVYRPENGSGNALAFVLSTRPAEEEGK